MIQQLSRLMTCNICSLWVVRFKPRSCLLLCSVQSHIFHLSRIGSPQSSHQGLKIAIQRFSGTSRQCVEKNSKFGRKNELCQVFDQNEMLVGHMTLDAAESLAKKENLKLVDWGENPDKLQSYRLMSGRELAEQEIRLKKEKKSEKIKEKEFRVSTSITDHDLEIKVRQVQDVVSRGGHVKFVIKAHKKATQDESGKQISLLMNKVMMQLKDCAVIKKGIRKENEQQLQLQPVIAKQTDDSE